MDQVSAIRIIKDTLNNSYNKDTYTRFIRELFNSIEEAPFTYQGNYIPDSFEPHIKSLERIGKYQDAEGNKIDILAVHLKKESSLEHARTMQRNFIAWYLNGSRGGELKDAAVVAFVSPGTKDWRFSLVKMEYRLVESEKGKVKAQQELTPARRWSFLVGENEDSHTAQKQLLPLLQDDQNNLLLSELQNAFNVEVVTKEFFEKYRDLFNDVRDSLSNVLKKYPNIKQEFYSKNIDTVDFSKKLLGQIVFLYFLQKKGWFGVERDAIWGSGPKSFLRLLFEKQVADYDNYFNDILEPLFYEALARERDDDFYSRFNCKIPFLNGGLFDPIGDYDWVHTDIVLPNELFSNDIRTKQGDIGIGILDVFDRYNFTVKEDEPLEKEVAVDPEMLGKVFENLLEVKDRKSKGTYYTPREIVHYMCQETLINYLTNKLAGLITENDISRFVRLADLVLEHDNHVEQAGKETKTYSYKIPESIRKYAKEIDQRLEEIKICDPAIGSAAFPVGMMNEIVRLRDTLTTYIEDKSERSIYDLKRHTIQNSLYGVDIDLGATEIAKLRLWLSLVVDEEDIKQIKPLPNLDYKIMQGNSLVELLSPALLARSTDKERNDLIDQLNESKNDYFNLSDRSSKNQKRKEINSLIQTLVNYDVKKEKDRIFEKIVGKKNQIKLFSFGPDQQSFDDLDISKEVEKANKLKDISSYDHFEWHLNFNEIFENGGFDVVIGNPPYSRIQGIDKAVVGKYKHLYNSATGRFDLYVLFVEKGLELASSEVGQVNYIMPHKWTNASYGKGLREFVASKRSLSKLISFGAYQVFNASTYTSLNWFKKISDGKIQYTLLDKDLKTNNELDIYLRKLNQDDFAKIDAASLNGRPWVLTNSEVEPILDKLRGQPHTIKDVFEGIYQGIVTTGDDIFHLKGAIRGTEFYGFSERLKKEVVLEADIIKPLLMGDDIVKYASQLKNKVYVIYPHYLDKEGKTKPYEEDKLKDLFPRVYEYLLKFKDELRSKKVKYKTNPKYWYALHRSREIDVFEQEKIITPYLSIESSMTLDNQHFYTNAKCYNLIKKKAFTASYKFYLAILNSKLLWFYLKNTGTMFRGGYFVFTSDYLDQFPLPNESDVETLNLLEQKVNQIFLVTSQPGYSLKNPPQELKRLEWDVDQIVYKLYNLTPEEIAVVEGIENNYEPEPIYY